MKGIVIAFLLLMPNLVVHAQTLNAERGYEFTPEDFGMDYEEVKVKTDDNVTLTCWHIKPLDTKSKKAFIVSHNGDGNMSNAMERAANFVSLGYHVFMYDYRGYGTSDEFRISPKFYIYSQFSNDLRAVIKHVRKYHATFSISLFGYGVGGGISVGAGANTPEVEYVVADGAYPSIETVTKRYEEVKGEKILAPFGYDKVFMEPKFALELKPEHLKGVLLIVGGAGTLITPQDMKELQDLHKKVVDVYVVPGVDNDMNFDANKDEYFNRIKAMLNK